MPVARHGALPTRLAQGRLDAKIINPSRLAFNTESLRWLPTLSVNRACAGSLCRNAWDKCEVGMARGFPACRSATAARRPDAASSRTVTGCARSAT